MSPESGIAQKLNAALSEVNHSAPSVTKYKQVQPIIAELAGLPETEVNIYFVSKPGNLDVRFRQPGVLKARPGLGVAVLKSAEDLAACISPGHRVLQPKGPVGALAFCAKQSGGSWKIVAVVEPEGGEIAPRLKAIFPDLDHYATKAAPKEPEDHTTKALSLDVEELASSLYLAPDWVEDVIWMLRDKGGAILYGPPGTGKTFIAQRIAEALQEDEQMRSLVQLHPSYGYEDFFEGFRPAASDSVALVKKDGPLRLLARAAESRKDENAVLVLDEINRGNLPKVFGELFFLLEYREHPVRLMYSPDEPFTLPQNLLFIGTMNTADRSVALLDQALRRRFHFAPLFPGEWPVSDMLRRYLQANRPDMEWVAELLDLTNQELGDRDMAIGPSYFMRSDLDQHTLDRLWRYSIIPTIEEQFPGEPARLEDFELNTLVEKLKQPSPEPNDL